MAGILSGLARLGLDNLENMSIFEEKKNKPKEQKAEVKEVELREEDFVFDKAVECPVCGEKFYTKVMKTGKAKLLGTDQDLRARYEGIDAVKYDVVQCTHCGYAALTRYFAGVTSLQAKLIQENICKNVVVHAYPGAIYSYEEALQQYKLALANAVVKKAKNSEKAYICLKSAWLVRGYREDAQKNGKTELVKDLESAELEYIQNAYDGFVSARQTENFPMCGMDENTIDYLIAALALKLDKLDVAGRMVSSIIASPNANSRAKEKARLLKEAIMEKAHNA